MSLPIFPKGVGSALTLPLLLGQAWPLPFLSFWLDPWPFLSPLFGWLSPLALGQTRPEGPTLTRKGRANLHPRRKADPYPGKGGPTRQELPTPNCWKRKGQPPLRKLPTPSQGGRPTSTPRKNSQNPQPEKGKPKRKKTTHMKNRKN